MKNAPHLCNPSRLRINCFSRLGCSSNLSCKLSFIIKRAVIAALLSARLNLPISSIQRPFSGGVDCGGLRACVACSKP